MDVKLYYALLAALAAERLVELFISRRNARQAFARGGVETGAAHFRWMAALHALLFPACLLEADKFHAAPALAVLLAQGLRWWAIQSLGPSWNVRIIVVPGSPPIRRGPYRWLRHPNYVAVAVEMLAVPLAGGAWICAVIFSALNAWVLRVRIRDEERALGPSWQREFAQTPRFIPHG